MQSKDNSQGQQSRNTLEDVSSPQCDIKEHASIEVSSDGSIPIPILSVDTLGPSIQQVGI